MGLYAQTLENSVRQFAITFLCLIGSNPQFEGAFRRLLPVPGLPASHRDRSEFFCHKRYTLFSLFSELQMDLISLRTKEALSAKRAQGQILGKPKDTLQKSKFDQNLEKNQRITRLWVLGKENCSSAGLYKPYCSQYLYQQARAAPDSGSLKSGLTEFSKVWAYNSIFCCTPSPEKIRNPRRVSW